MGATVGIDLGTTNSCISSMDGDDPMVMPNSEGSKTTPSIVAETEENDRIIGELAKRQSQTNAENTIYAVKRLIGKGYDDEDVERARENVSYQIVKSENGDAWVELRGEAISPAEISAYILRNLKAAAEEHLGQEVTDAVIAVPAYFNDAQREATKNAGKIAGLDVLRLVNEPTAAALAHGYGEIGEDTSQDYTIGVYDLGGGTFDISLLDITDDVFSVMSTAGDTFLGGEDFDNRIVEWLAGEFRAEHGVDLTNDEMALQRLKEEAERAKCELSSMQETEIALPFIYSDREGPKSLETTLTRDKLEELVSDLVEKTLEPCQQALADADISRQDLDDIIMVGGMTRMPLVRRHVSEFFDNKVDTSVNPEHIVAEGAAIQGSIAQGNMDDVLLLDVTPLTLGIETEGGVFTPLIPRNTTIPCSHTATFSTTKDDQSMVRVHVLQGERSMAEHNQSLAQFELRGIPPAPRGVPKIEVTFDIDENGMVNVSAVDKATGEKQSVDVVADGGLSDEEIEEMIEDAEEFVKRDKKRKEREKLRSQVRDLIKSAERSFEHYGEGLSADEKERLTEKIENMKSSVQGAGKKQLEDMLEELRESAHHLSELIYQDTNDEEATGH